MRCHARKGDSPFGSWHPSMQSPGTVDSVFEEGVHYLEVVGGIMLSALTVGWSFLGLFTWRFTCVDVGK